MNDKAYDEGLEQALKNQVWSLLDNLKDIDRLIREQETTHLDETDPEELSWAKGIRARYESILVVLELTWPAEVGRIRESWQSEAWRASENS